MNDNIWFECYKCGHRFLAAIDEYKTVFWHGKILKEAYCPICGKYLQQEVSSLR